MPAHVSPPALDTLSPEARLTYDRLVTTRGWAPQIFLVCLHSPVLLSLLTSIGEFFRAGRSVFDEQTRELATLTVARETSSLYEWSHHVRSAEELGISGDLVDQIAHGLLQQEEGLVGATSRFVRLVAAGEPIDDPCVDEIKDAWGDQGVIELTILACYYVALARLATALDVQLEPGIQPRSF